VVPEMGAEALVFPADEDGGKDVATPVLSVSSDVDARLTMGLT